MGPVLLGDARDDALQDLHEARAVGLADDPLQVLLVVHRPPGEFGQHGFPCGREEKLVAAPVFGNAAPRDETAPREIGERGRQGGLVAPVRLAQRRLADAGVAADQHEEGEAAGPNVEFLGETREGLEGRGLGEAQVEPEPVRKRTEIDVGGQRGRRQAHLARGGTSGGLCARAQPAGGPDVSRIGAPCPVHGPSLCAWRVMGLSRSFYILPFRFTTIAG